MNTQILNLYLYQEHLKDGEKHVRTNTQQILNLYLYPEHLKPTTKSTRTQEKSIKKGQHREKPTDTELYSKLNNQLQFSNQSLKISQW